MRDPFPLDPRGFAPLVIDARKSVPSPTLQTLVAAEARRRWPNMTVVTEGLALAEEAGEVCRAILKRHEGTRGTPEEWTAGLRTEIGQTICVLLHLAEMEGFDGYEAACEAYAGLLRKPDRGEGV